MHCVGGWGEKEKHGTKNERKQKATTKETNTRGMGVDERGGIVLSGLTWLKGR